MHKLFGACLDSTQFHVLTDTSAASIFANQNYNCGFGTKIKEIFNSICSRQFRLIYTLKLNPIPYFDCSIHPLPILIARNRTVSKKLSNKREMA